MDLPPAIAIRYTDHYFKEKFLHFSRIFQDADENEIISIKLRPLENYSSDMKDLRLLYLYDKDYEEIFQLQELKQFHGSVDSEKEYFKSDKADIFFGKHETGMELVMLGLTAISVAPAIIGLLKEGIMWYNKRYGKPKRFGQNREHSETNKPAITIEWRNSDDRYILNVAELPINKKELGDFLKPLHEALKKYGRQSQNRRVG
jgi:hypothetical protein